MRPKFKNLLVSAALPLMAAATPVMAEEVVIASTGGTFAELLEENFYKPFAEETGIDYIRVDTELHTQFAKMQAGAESGNVEYDVITAGPNHLIAYREFLQPIDCDSLPNVELHGIDNACTGWGIVRTLGGMALAYNTEEFDTVPENWAALWDVENFPGPRGLPNTEDREWTLPAMALLVDGVAPEDLFPLDLDRAYAKLDELKPHVAVWYTSNSQAQQALRDEEMVMAMLVSGRIIGVKEEGYPVDINWKNSFQSAAFWAVAKNGPNTEGAMEFLNFFLANPEAHLAFGNEVNYDTGNRTALELIPEEEKTSRVAHPDNLSSMIVPDYAWLAENNEMLLERWNEWIIQ